MGLRLFNIFVTTITLFAVAVLAHGQGGNPQSSDTFTPVGRWKTVDDVTGKTNSVVDIWEENGKLYGKIDRLTDPIRMIRIPAASGARVISKTGA